MQTNTQTRPLLLALNVPAARPQGPLSTVHYFRKCLAILERRNHFTGGEEVGGGGRERKLWKQTPYIWVVVSKYKNLMVLRPQGKILVNINKTRKQNKVNKHGAVPSYAHIAG